VGAIDVLAHGRGARRRSVRVACARFLRVALREIQKETFSYVIFGRMPIDPTALRATSAAASPAAPTLRCRKILAAACLVAALGAGCGSGRSADAPRENPTPAPTNDTPAPPPPPTPTGDVIDPDAPPEVAAVQTWDAEGISIEALPDSSIRVRGEDRWGVRIDTVYADATYFANAVPVLSRSLSEAQARALTTLIPSIRTASGAPGAAP